MTLDSVRKILSDRMLSVWVADAGSAELFIAGVQEPDLTQQTEPFALFSIDLPDIRQSGLNGNNPPQRGYSFVRVDLFAKVGSGTKPLFMMLEVVRTAFATQLIGDIRLYGITCRQRDSAVGWQSWSISVPIQFDSIT